MLLMELGKKEKEPEGIQDNTAAIKTDTRKTRLTLEQLSKLRKLCLLYTSPSPRDRQKSRMPSSA